MARIPNHYDDETRAAVLELRQVGRQIETGRAKLDALYERRTELYLQLRDPDGPALQLREIAEHARTTEAAVMQALLKARAAAH